MTDKSKKAEHQAFSTIQFISEWRQIAPRVYRYLDNAEFADAWINHGDVMLSSFARFAEHKDEQRCDTREGEAMLFGKAADGSTMVSHTRSGQKSWILSAATRLTRDLWDQFNAKAVVEITHTMGFAMAISRYVPGFAGGFEAPCIYRPERMISRSIPHDLKEIMDDPAQRTFSTMGEIIGATSRDDPLLLKLKSYEHQSEYRFVWNAESPAKGNLMVRSPSVRDFCRLVDESEFGDRVTAPVNRVPKRVPGTKPKQRLSALTS